MNERSDIRQRFRASRSFYIGVPFLAVVLGLCGSVIAVVSIAPSDRVFFPQYPAGQSDAIALIAFGCAAAGFAALLLMALSKFVLKSNHRTSIILACFAAWGGWASYIVANADFGDGAFFRTALGHHYAIPWERVPRRVTGMTDMDAPLKRWAEIDPIGFTYCAKPFDALPNVTNNCRAGILLAGRPGLERFGDYRTNQPTARNDPDGLDLLDQLETQQRDRAFHESQAALMTRNSREARPFSAVDLGYEISGVRTDDVDGMMAFENTEPWPFYRTIYLFTRPSPDASSYHRATCSTGLRSIEPPDSPVICTHYIRRGDRAWVFDLPIEETALAERRLRHLIEQLNTFKVRQPAHP